VSDAQAADAQAADAQAADAQAADALAAELGLGPHAETALTTLAALYEALDVTLTARAAGLELPCRAGCDACCHESVFVSAPEVLAVFVYLRRTRSLAARLELLAEMRALAHRFEDELELLETITPGAERDEVAARVKFRCPLLGAAGECTIYPVRELNARTFGQAWDSARGEAYGCGLTQARLRVLPPAVGPSLVEARAPRRALQAAFPSATEVHVYPWWFARYGEWLVAS
jgi:Fe-S-cluster containining protein